MSIKRRWSEISSSSMLSSISEQAESLISSCKTKIKRIKIPNLELDGFSRSQRNSTASLSSTVNPPNRSNRSSSSSFYHNSQNRSQMENPPSILPQKNEQGERVFYAFAWEGKASTKDVSSLISSDSSSKNSKYSPGNEVIEASENYAMTNVPSLTYFSTISSRSNSLHAPLRIADAHRRKSELPTFLTLEPNENCELSNNVDENILEIAKVLDLSKGRELGKTLEYFQANSTSTTLVGSVNEMKELEQEVTAVPDKNSISFSRVKQAISQYWNALDLKNKGLSIVRRNRSNTPLDQLPSTSKSANTSLRINAAIGAPSLSSLPLTGPLGTLRQVHQKFECALRDAKNLYGFLRELIVVNEKTQWNIRNRIKEEAKEKAQKEAQKEIKREIQEKIEREIQEKIKEETEREIKKFDDFFKELTQHLSLFSEEKNFFIALKKDGYWHDRKTVNDCQEKLRTFQQTSQNLAQVLEKEIPKDVDPLAKTLRGGEKEQLFFLQKSLEQLASSLINLHEALALANVKRPSQDNKVDIGKANRQIVRIEIPEKSENPSRYPMSRRLTARSTAGFSVLSDTTTLVSSPSTRSPKGKIFSPVFEQPADRKENGIERNLLGMQNYALNFSPEPNASKIDKKQASSGKIYESIPTTVTTEANITQRKKEQPPAKRFSFNSGTPPQTQITQDSGLRFNHYISA